MLTGQRATDLSWALVLRVGCPRLVTLQEQSFSVIAAAAAAAAVVVVVVVVVKCT